MMEKYALIKALKAMVEAPSKSFSVRGLASEIGMSPGAARTSLDYLRKKGIVSLKVIGITYQYKACLESPLCRQWKILFNVDKLTDSGIIGEITRKIPDVQSILLYGSFGRGTNDEKSDVDLLVISHNPKVNDHDFGGKLAKEANITVLSMANWRQKALRDKVFYENVIYDSIALYGERPVVT